MSWCICFVHTCVFAACLRAVWSGVICLTVLVVVVCCALLSCLLYHGCYAIVDLFSDGRCWASLWSTFKKKKVPTRVQVTPRWDKRTDSQRAFAECHIPLYKQRSHRSAQSILHTGFCKHQIGVIRPVRQGRGNTKQTTSHPYTQSNYRAVMTQRQ